MFKGGPIYNDRSAQVIRFAGLMVPAILIFYGVLVQAGILDNSHYKGDLIFIAIALSWALIATLQYIHQSSSRLQSAIRLIAYHILAAAYLVFVSGFSTPFVICWLILLLATNAYFGKSGLRLSILGLVATVVIDMLYWLQTDPDNALSDLLALIAILVAGLMLVSITRSQEIDKTALSRSEAQESLERERLITLVNNLADAILSVDTDGIIRVFNAASLNLLDTNDSLEGRSVNDVLRLQDADDQPIELFKELQAAKSVATRQDLNYVFSDGEKIRLEITYSPIRSSYSRSHRGEKKDGYIVIMRDITKQKSLEEERDEFISVVSHELRTPITIVEGTLSNTQLMIERGKTEPDTIKKAVDTAHDQVIYLAKMVNDLSTLSRAERGVADAPEEIDVKDLVRTLYKQYEKSASEKGLRLNLSESTHLGSISVSRLYIEELLQNFITNAIKYTVEGSVTLAARASDGTVTFSVKDSGIGMSKTDQKRIFDKFYRAEDYRTRETSGTGLGLYVAAKLARKIGTTIELTSRLNHGSTFSFSLPLSTKK